MKKYFIVICFMFLASIALGQSKYKIGPIEIEDNDTTAEFTNRNLKTNSITATTMDVTGDMKTKALYSAPIVITGTVIDWSEGNLFSKTFIGEDEITFTNVTPGQIISFITYSAGSPAVTFDNINLYWQDGTEPTSTASAYDVYTFIALDVDHILGTSAQNFYQP